MPSARLEPAKPDTTPTVVAADLLPPSTLNARISVSTPTRALTWTRAYALEDGRIWWTPYEQGQPTGAPWQLLAGTGLPFSTPEHPISPPGKLMAISADDLFLLAVAEDGSLYYFDRDHWVDQFGLPSPVLAEIGPLKLPSDTRAWALSVRHQQVEYYEDVLGNAFNYGKAGCTSFYALASDGQQLRHGDPWFPPDFSRQMCGPRRGAFVAENISSSASTTFLIGRGGTLYTRFYDYDSNGGTPFFYYRYGANAPRHTLAGTDPASETQVRALPAEPWTEESRIDTGAHGRLTRNISILQNGKGNSARELRVQGLGPDGQAGYYFKPLRSTTWSFQATGELIHPADFIANDAALDADGPTRDRPFTGRIWKGLRADPRISRVEIPDLHFHCSPFHLVLHLRNGERVNLVMHAVDVWTLTRDEDAELNPLAVRKLKGTLEIPPETLASTDALTRAVLRDYFLDSHLDSFEWAIVATQTVARLYRVAYPVAGAVAHFELRLEAGGPEVLRQSQRELPLYTRALLRFDEQPGLLPRDPAALALTTSDGDVTQTLLQRVVMLEQERDRLVQAREALEYQSKVSRRLLIGLPATTLLVDVLSVLTTARFTVDSMAMLDGLEEHLPALLSTARQSHEVLLERSKRDYERAQRQLDASVCRHGATLKQLEGIGAWEALEQKYPVLPDWMAARCPKVPLERGLAP